jgi:Icc-related predicted phosphoesterase
MRILHTSDLHGHIDALLPVMAREDFDVWVDSGDFFPNESRGLTEIEVPFQTEWAHDFRAELADIFGDKPVITVPGNHDYADLATILRDLGVDAHSVSELSPVTLEGRTFGGFRYVPWLAGEWNGEAHGFGEVVDRIFAQDIDILVTHAPAAGILDAHGHSPGIRELTTALAYRPHRIVAHLFGHIHESGGQTLDEMGIRFHNGAGHAEIVEV